MRAFVEPHVLLVEDEPAAARAHALWLGRAGLIVDVCDSPVGALIRIAAGERFDAVVCDGPMSGLDCVAFFVRASRCWPELARKIVFVSPGVSDEWRRFIEQRGLPVFDKPPEDHAEREALVSVIRRLADPPDDWSSPQ
jgi:CheY-like chemotaxis protein